MNVLIVAKTRRGSGACIGGITEQGKSVRLEAFDAATNERAGLEYHIGELWEVEATSAPNMIAPHVENVIVRRKHKIATAPALISRIEQAMPAQTGGIDVLYDGLLQTASGALYIAEQAGVPAYSTLFWRPDRPLQRCTEGKRIRYRYPTEDGGRTLVFVGFQEPLELIPAGTLLRVSLAHWWRPQDDPGHELRCYVQLSGWFLEDPGLALPTELASEPGHASPSTAGHALGAAPPIPQQVLKSVFGYDEFRPNQAVIVTNVLQKRDTLVIMPTGGGKSLCYQLPALIFPGLTVVISPLIALMQDQVEQMRELGVSAVFLNSSLSYADYVATTSQIRQGEVKLLYVAPETLLRPETLLLLEQAQVDCLAIDEAHCISQWGHDFRPEYRQLAPVRQRFAQAVCIALTATATPRVQEDIKQSLQLRDENAFVTSFDRTNLFITVAPKINTLQQTLDFLAIHPNQSGIIYCSTRQQVDDLAATLAEHKIACLPYHAGLDDATRQRNQRAFIRDDVPLMVATVAFGMGIDKPDVRFVLHVDLPKEIESYYQQIGRAGRDGLHADCLLLFSRGDVRTIMHFIEQGAASEQRERTLRLQALVGWAESDLCRRRQLLAYFGESYTADNCQMCDNCLRQDQERIDLTLPAQKFLSCVLRTRELYGVNYTIQVLRGSQAQEVLQRGHDKLSTYNIGGEFPADTWKHLARQFLQQGLLEQDMQIGSLKLTAKGRGVLKGEQVWGTLAEETTTSTQLEPIAYDLGLFSQLRTLRKELADAAQVPPYVIFPDRSLQEMATYFPHSPTALARLHGVGAVKLEKYADHFLPLIQTYCQEHALAERAKSNQPMVRRQAVGKARWAEVGEAYLAGESIAALMEVYSVKRQTVIQNLSRFVESGQRVPVERLRGESQLSADLQARVFATFAELGAERLGPVFVALQEAVSYDELHLLRIVYWAGSDGSPA